MEASALAVAHAPWCNLILRPFSRLDSIASDTVWRKPLQLSKAAAALPKSIVKPGSVPVSHLPVPRPRVFVDSPLDLFFDGLKPILNAKLERLYFQVPHDWRTVLEERHAKNRTGTIPVTMDDVRIRLFELIDRTPNLTWMIPTRYPENVARLWPREPKTTWMSKHAFRTNVCVGVYCRNQAEAQTRLPIITGTHFLFRRNFAYMVGISEQIDLRLVATSDGFQDLLTVGSEGGHEFAGSPRRFLDSVIVGGDFDRYSKRPIHPDWIRMLQRQCKEGDVRFAFVGWGYWREPRPGERYDTSKGASGRPPAFIMTHDGSVHCFRNAEHVSPTVMINVGIREAGAKLDDVEYSEMPDD